MKTPCHLIWLGSNPPQHVIDTVNEWVYRKPNLEVRLWTDSSLEDIGEGPWRNQSLHPAQRADFLRVALVRNYGGIYADVDCRPGGQDLEQPGNKLTFPREDASSLTNAFFQGSKGNPFYKYWERAMELGLRSQIAQTQIAESTGPRAISRALYDMAYDLGALEVRKSVQVLPYRSFGLWSASMSVGRDSGGANYEVARHVGLASWAETQHNNSVIRRVGKTLFWTLRRSALGQPVDLVRLLIRRRDLLWPILRGKLSIKVLQNCDIRVVDDISLQALLPFTPDSEIDLRDLVGNLSIMSIRARGMEDAEALSNAGWIQVNGVFVRPNIYQIVSHV